MALWKPPPVAEEPEITIINWSVMELPGDIRKFVGQDANGDGRVSSAIVKFDKRNRKGVTKSGRKYKLEGQPGHSDNAEYVWRMMLARKNVDPTSVRDVTEEYRRDEL